MALIGLDSRVTRSQGLICATVSDGVVMLSAEAGKYFSLNATAAAIWRRLESPISARELCNALAEEFDATADRAAPAVLAFLTKLIDEKVAFVPSQA
jgi:Coenzyme PQQ synthesis protein D (PqqD)